MADHDINHSLVKYNFLAISLGGQTFCPTSILFNTTKDAQRIAERISEISLNGNIVNAEGTATG